jgi:hypothetical protein
MSWHGIDPANIPLTRQNPATEFTTIGTGLSLRQYRQLSRQTLRASAV